MAVKKNEAAEPEKENQTEAKNAAPDGANSAIGAMEQRAGITNITAETNAAQPATDAQKQFVYIGPSIPRGKLQKYAIFTGTRKEVETYLADALEKYPKIKSLIVPIEELAESREKAEKPGNAFNKFYIELASEFKA